MFRFCVSVFLLIATPSLASPGRLGGGGALDVSLTRIVMSLLLCVMIALLAALAMRRGGGRLDLKAVRGLFLKLPAPRRRIEVIETRRVSQHADVALLRCDDREYLVLCGANQQTILCEMPSEAKGEG